MLSKLTNLCVNEAPNQLAQIVKSLKTVKFLVLLLSENELIGSPALSDVQDIKRLCMNIVILKNISKFSCDFTTNLTLTLVKSGKAWKWKFSFWWKREKKSLRLWYVAATAKVYLLRSKTFLENWDSKAPSVGTLLAYSEVPNKRAGRLCSVFSFFQKSIVPNRNII